MALLSTYKQSTNLTTETICLDWTLDLRETRNSAVKLEQLTSPEFTVKNLSKTCFFEFHYPGRLHKEETYNVVLEKCNEFQNCSISLRIFDNILKDENMFRLLYVTGNRIESVYNHKSYFYHSYFIPSPTNSLYTVRKISCKIKYFTIKEPVMLSLENLMPNIYGKLLKNQELCDITFLIGAEKIKAHTVILAGASAYFLAMFKNKDMIENVNRKVDLSNDDDVTVDNFQGLIDYIYECKSIDDLSNIVYELIVLADKFDVKHLFLCCQNYISKNIIEEDIVKILILSDKYNCELLKKNAIDYAKSRIDVVKKSDDFDNLCKITDVMRSLL